MSAFACCYLVFPFFLTWLRKKSVRYLLSVLVVCVAGSIGMMFLWMQLVPTALYTILRQNALFRFPQFLMGMSAAMATKKAPALRYPTLVAELCTFFLLANLFICAYWTAAQPVLYLRYSVYITYLYYAEWIAAPLQTLWVVALCSPGCSGPTRFFLSSLPLRALGAVSYSLYVLHWPTLQWSAWAVAGKVSATAVPKLAPFGLGVCFFFSGWALAPLLAVCLSVATVAYFVLEAPARKAIAPPRAPDDLELQAAAN